MRVVALPDTGLKSSARHVAHILGLYFDPRGDSCWPSVATIAGRTGYCERTVYYALAQLIEHGWVEKISRPGRTNRYRATIPEWAMRQVAIGREPWSVVEGKSETLDEGAGRRSPQVPPASSSSAPHARIRRGHIWLENVGVHYESEADVRDELQRIIGDETAAEWALERWRDMTGRAGPPAAADAVA